MTDTQVRQLLKDGGLEPKTLAALEQDVEVNQLDFQQLEEARDLDLLRGEDSDLGDEPQRREEEKPREVQSQVKVRLDSWSHLSGHRRCWVTCNRRQNCRKSGFIKDGRYNM